MIKYLYILDIEQGGF